MLKLLEFNTLSLMLITMPSSILENKVSLSIFKCLKLDGRGTSRTTVAQPWCSAKFTKALIMRISPWPSKCKETSSFKKFIKLSIRKSTPNSTLWAQNLLEKTMILMKFRDFWKPVGPSKTMKQPKVPRRRALSSSAMTYWRLLMTTRMPGHSNRL